MKGPSSSKTAGRFTIKNFDDSQKDSTSIEFFCIRQNEMPKIGVSVTESDFGRTTEANADSASNCFSLSVSEAQKGDDNNEDDDKYEDDEGDVNSLIFFKEIKSNAPSANKHQENSSEHTANPNMFAEKPSA